MNRPLLVDTLTGRFWPIVAWREGLQSILESGRHFIVPVKDDRKPCIAIVRLWAVAIEAALRVERRAGDTRLSGWGCRQITRAAPS